MGLVNMKTAQKLGSEITLNTVTLTVLTLLFLLFPVDEFGVVLVGSETVGVAEGRC